MIKLKQDHTGAVRFSKACSDELTNAIKASVLLCIRKAQGGPGR